MRRLILAAGVAVLALGASAGCATSSERGQASYVGPSIAPSSSPAPSPKPPPPQVIAAGILYAPANFNPYTSIGDVGETRDVVAGLLPSAFVQQPSYGYQRNADLLQEAEEHRDKGKQSVEYRIAEGAVWSDGTPITAADFIYLWQQSKHGTSVEFPGYDRISGVHQKGGDPRDVVVEFHKPFSEWQSLFDPLLPSKTMKKSGFDDAMAHEVPVSGGPFSMTSASRSTIVLEPNEHYYGQKANLKKLTFRVLPSPDALSVALAAGEIDVATSSTAARSTSNSSTITTSVGKLPGLDEITFNTRSKVVGSEAVRHAIAYGIDRAAIQRAVAPAGGVASAVGNHLLQPGRPGYSDNGGDFGYDSARAKTALLSAGFKADSNGRIVKNGKQLQLRLVVPLYNAVALDIGQLIQHQLQQLGVAVRLTPIEANQLFQHALPGGDFDLAVTGYITPHPVLDGIDQYGCHGPTNYSKFCSSKVDDLFEQAASAADTDAAAGLLDQVDRRLWQSLPVIPLYQPFEYIYTASGLTGPQFDPALESLYWNASTWQVE